MFPVYAGTIFFGRPNGLSDPSWRECKEIFNILQKIFKIFLIPPARTRPAAGPARGPGAGYLRHSCLNVLMYLRHSCLNVLMYLRHSCLNVLMYLRHSCLNINMPPGTSSRPSGRELAGRTGSGFGQFGHRFGSGRTCRTGSAIFSAGRARGVFCSQFWVESLRGPLGHFGHSVIKNKSRRLGVAAQHL